MSVILAVDPGEKQIGLALSDPTGTLARPYQVIEHTQRDEDAMRIAEIATAQMAQLILVGQATDSAGDANLSGRKARRFAAAIREHTFIRVELWDETSSTQTAQETLREMGVPPEKRAALIDAQAAAVILQSYLDAQNG
jgi:putative Holliday junction resolvase